VQSPSSLIFLVLLGVWAAYFVQYWVRRRDHLATARSVEQFSEAMRVLERRDPLPHTDLSEPAPRSYAVHPARTSRPQVLVKRAVAYEPGSPAVTERISDDSDAVAPLAASVTRPLRSASPAPAQAGPVRRPAGPAGPAGPASAAGVDRPRGRVRPNRRARGLLLLAALAELLVISGLVATSLLPLWALAPALLAVGSALLFVRAGVRAEQARAHATRQRQADLARGRTSVPVAARSTRVSRPAAPLASGRAAGASAAETVEVLAGTDAATVATPIEPVPAGTDPYLEQPAAEASEPGRVAEPVEPVAPVEAAYDVMRPILDEDDIPLTWDPVPVPRPTYTMKAKAQRPEVAPAAVTPDPTPVVRGGASDDAGYDQRRVAGG